MVNVPQAVTAAVSKDELFIPLIDFSLFLKGTDEDKKAAANVMVDGFKNAGFIYIKNHGVSQPLIDRVFAESARFFARPKDQKNTLAWTTPQSNRGYVSQGREKVTQLDDPTLIQALRNENPDLKESFEIGRDHVPGLPNHWPEHLDEEGKVFTETMKTFFETCKGLHIEVMRAIGLGMGLEMGFFDKFTSGGDNTLRLLHYPAVKQDVFVKNRDQVRAGKHTDYGSITLLFQDDRGGLQVRSPQGTFVNATPIPGTIVINAGDLLARWSNCKIKSTEHQVVEPPIAPDRDEYPARYSCAYFCNPNFDQYIEALPGTYQSEEDKRFPGILSGDYLVQRLQSTYTT
ncbi:hypothetical protein DFP73DRAFT_482991 [Morchella snyderi]|nr:hypothetical protein DFP73DRAFT_482991 [Morchella snyderi]